MKGGKSKGRDKKGGFLGVHSRLAGGSAPYYSPTPHTFHLGLLKVGHRQHLAWRDMDASRIPLVAFYRQFRCNPFIVPGGKEKVVLLDEGDSSGQTNTAAG